MTTKAKITIKESIADLGSVEITVVKDGIVENKTYTDYEEAVSDVEFYENMDCEVFI